MKSNRPAYIERKIALEWARREARRTHEQPCDCPYCITAERQRELLAHNLARNASASQEVPF